MKNIIKPILLSMLMLTTSISAQNLTLIKKDKFTTCKQIEDYGNYRGKGDYILYNEEQNSYTKYCELEKVVFKQENFSGLSAGLLSEISKTEHHKVKIYHSEDLYYVFEQKVINDRNFLETKNAIEVVNTNNVSVGDYIVIISNPYTSGIITSDSGAAWCYPINGKYSIGCGSTKGLGNWEIIIIY